MTILEMQRRAAQKALAVQQAAEDQAVPITDAQVKLVLAVADALIAELARVETSIANKVESGQHLVDRWNRPDDIAQ